MMSGARSCRGSLLARRRQRCATSSSSANQRKASLRDVFMNTRVDLHMDLCSHIPILAGTISARTSQSCICMRNAFRCTHAFPTHMSARMVVHRRARTRGRQFRHGRGRNSRARMHTVDDSGRPGRSTRCAQTRHFSYQRNILVIRGTYQKWTGAGVGTQCSHVC